MDKLDWVERGADENLKFRLQVAESLAKECAGLLLLLMTAIGGALAYVVQVLDRSSAVTPLLIGVSAVMVWWMCVGVLLMWKCVLTRSIPVPGMMPVPALHASLDGYSLEALRKFQLQHVQSSIDSVMVRNGSTAVWLDRCRLAFLASPLFLGIVSGLVWVAL